MKEQDVNFGDGLQGILSGAAQRNPVIITHGAGQGMSSNLLKKTAHRLAEHGFLVLRFNFAYMNRKSAPSAGGKKEEPDLVAALEFMKEYGDAILIGRSFGARVAANVSLERDDIKALAFYGMPLQGASKTAKPRDWSHLNRIKVPMLFVTGDKDQLCPLDRLTDVLKDVKVPVTKDVVPGDHGFKPKSEDLAIEICTKWVENFASIPGA